jgi:O-antigen ligase
VVLAGLAYARPGYFGSLTYLGGLLLVELLIAAVWLYRRVFFPLVILTFLLAGVNLPVGSVWTVLRWIVLAVGALVGVIITLREGRHQFGLFDVLGLFAVLAALVSAAVSRYTNLSLLKALSLFLLFLYAGTGSRLAVIGRDNRFFSGLLIACEVFVGAVATGYAAGISVMGNPNSLGAVMGVVASPLLLWGTLVSETCWVRRRRAALYAIAMYLTFASSARAGIAAALFSCGLLCLALRRYRLLLQGIVIIVILSATAAIVQPEAFSRVLSSLSFNLIYKGKDTAAGLLASRASPWQNAVESIRNHFWFGTGFGTSDRGTDASENIGNFSTVSTTSAEHGSSYLAITTWVGMVGVLPFLMLLLMLLKNVIRTLVWMFRTGNPLHPAVPLALVMVAGITHAGLEDWLFAPGYYLCVFFWSMAFVFVERAASLAPADARPAFFRRTMAMRQGLGNVAPSQ